MANNELLMNANEVVAFLQKPSSEFTKEDIVRCIQENEIKMVNFDTHLWRTCRRVQPILFHPSRQQRPLCSAAFLVGFRRSLRRNSYALHACILFRQGRQSAGKLARIHVGQGCKGFPRGYGYGISCYGRTGILRDNARRGGVPRC